MESLGTHALVRVLFHTVYDSFESSTGGRDYIGKHSTYDPQDSYFGSFSDKSFKPDNKIVIGYSKTAEGAVWLEVNFHNVFNVSRDPQYANQVKQTSEKFDSTGTKPNPETLLKRSLSFRETIKNNPKEKKRRSEAISGDKNPSRRFPETPEQKEKRIDAVREAWKDHDLLARHSELQKRLQSDPETNWKRSKSIKEALNTPEEKERRSKESLARNWYSNCSGQRKFCKEHPGEGWEPGYFWRED